MRSFLLAALLPAVALAAPSRKPVIALLPAQAATPELTRLGLLMEARAAELLEASGKYTELHLKQVLAMAGQEALEPGTLAEDAVADQARGLLGADRVVTLRLASEGDFITVKGSIRSKKKPVAFSAKVPAGWVLAVPQGSEAIAKALLAQERATLPAKSLAQPESSSEAALHALGECWEIALKQPLGIEAPVTLAGEELDVALASCAKAVEADGSLRFARATLALMQAIAGEDAAATQSLAALGQSDAALEPWSLARFWLLTRYQSNEAGVGFLNAVLKPHPGQMILRTYLGETYASLGQQDKAAAVWNEYLALAPESAYAHGRLSRALARQDRHEAALAEASKGLTVSPSSREARLQLASRQIDAKKLGDAVATLQPMVNLQSPPAEHLLRMGWAYWLDNDPEAAARLFHDASQRAQSATDWRTRGRALYNLAMVEAKQGRLKEAKAAYAASLETGFVVAQPDPLLDEVIKAQSIKPANAKAAARVREASLFPADASGAVDPAAAKPAAPAGLQPFKP